MHGTVRNDIKSIALLASAVIVMIQSACGVRFGPLHDTISDHDRLFYNPIVTNNNRVKRDAGSQPVIDGEHSLKFSAHGRDFHLRIRHNPHIAAPGAVLEFKNKIEPLTFPDAVHGHLADEPQHSTVYGSIIDGVFRGVVHTADGTGWYVEPAHRYFHKPLYFHSIVYNDSHVRWPTSHKLGVLHHPPACGLADANTVSQMQHKPVMPLHTQHTQHTQHTSQYSMYSKLLNRQRRSARQPRVCSLYLQSDVMLWRALVKSETDEMEQERAKNEIKSLFHQHVLAASQIFSRAVFVTKSGGFAQYGINFNVNRIRINTTADCHGENEGKHFCNPNIDVTNFLNLHSYTNHSEHCLAYIFTYRDFKGGTLGLAWVGTKDQNGGICESYKRYDESSASAGRKNVKKSLNTGIVTLVNYERRLADKISYLTFAHEMGHNFGANHDDPLAANRPECQPSTDKGNYIMFSSATTGDKENNDKFSPCSNESIAEVLESVIFSRYGKVNCLKESKELAFCGNELKEEDEQCDCGYVDNCKDACCVPKGANQPNACKVRAGKQCSPSGNPCCKSNCNYSGSETQCRGSTECTEKTYCNGTSELCPDARHKPNNITCMANTKVCYRGSCNVSICSWINWEECQLTSKKDKTAQSASMCYLGCRPHNATQCISTRDVAVNANISSPVYRILQSVGETAEGLKLQIGSPCDDFLGYCDAYYECRRVDSKGPLGRLQELLFSPETIELVKTWIITYWYYVILICIGVLIVMGAFIKLCAVHTPSSNPNRPAARKLTLRRSAGNQHRRHQHRQQQPRQHRYQQQHVEPGMVPLGTFSYTGAQAAVPPAAAAAAAAGAATAPPAEDFRLQAAASSSSAAAAQRGLGLDVEPPPPYREEEKNLSQMSNAHGAGKRKGHRQALERQAAQFGHGH